MAAVRFGRAFAPCWTPRGSARQPLAIATTTSRDNIDVLLAASLGEDWTQWFTAIVAGDEVPRKKPAPDVYLKVLSQLDLPASQCLAIEDSGLGLAAASGAGIPVLISRSAYFSDDDFSGAAFTIDDFSEVAGIPENGSDTDWKILTLDRKHGLHFF